MSLVHVAPKMVAFKPAAPVTRPAVLVDSARPAAHAAPRTRFKRPQTRRHAMRDWDHLAAARLGHADQSPEAAE
jgi:hypothetical protein